MSVLLESLLIKSDEFHSFKMKISDKISKQHFNAYSSSANIEEHPKFYYRQTWDQTCVFDSYEITMQTG